MTSFEPPADASIVAGYRVVRRLGSGTRADVFLATAPSRDDNPPARVALKVFRPGVELASVDAEVAALSRLTSPHCVRLRDVSVRPGEQPVLVLDPVTGPALGPLLLARGAIGLGEAVTICAPLAATVAELHAAGVAHGALGAGAVFFGTRGEPVIVGFGSAGTFAAGLPPASLDGHPGAMADRVALATLVATVLGSVRDGERVPAVSALLRRLAARDVATDAGLCTRLEEALFDLGPGAPVEWAPPGAGREHGEPRIPGRLASGDPPERTAQPGRGTTMPAPAYETRRGRRVAEALVGDHPVADLARGSVLLSRGIRSLRGVGSAVLARVPSLTPLRMGLVVAIACVGVAVLVVPAGDEGAAAPVDDPAPSVTVPMPSESAPTPSDMVATGASTAAPSSQPRAPSGDATPDDPLAALPLLLAERERCLRDLEPACLARVDQAESRVLADDLALIRSALADTPIPADALPDPTGARLVQTLGGSVLLEWGDKEDPASALMIRDEAGWRLRMLRGSG